MSGTSMATPIATGVLARRLAADAAVLGMPRDSARAAAIVKLSRDHAEDLGLPPPYARRRTGAMITPWLATSSPSLPPRSARCRSLRRGGRRPRMARPCFVRLLARCCSRLRQPRPPRSQRRCRAGNTGRSGRPHACRSGRRSNVPASWPKRLDRKFDDDDGKGAAERASPASARCFRTVLSQASTLGGRWRMAATSARRSHKVGVAELRWWAPSWLHQPDGSRRVGRTDTGQRSCPPESATM